MRSIPILGFGLMLLLQLSAGSAGRTAGPPAVDAEFFEKAVRPLLVEKCGECHGEKRPRGGLKLTSRANMLRGGDNGPAVVSNKPDESLLLEAVRYSDELRMPPKGKLSQEQIEILENWVKRGAPWPGADVAPATTEGRFTITEKHRKFWAFQPFEAAPPPAVHDVAWPRSPIDRFLLAGLEASKISPAAQANKRTLLRRATFDLIGLPPTPEEIEAFTKDDSPEAFTKVVDRLLASPLYGERWGRHWLDVVRYADARDLIQLPRESDFREVWRYRDWVVDSFNRDLPYTDFVRSQVAGDLLPSSRPDRFDRDGLVATGMLAIADFVPGDVDKNQMIADYVNDQIDVVSRAFLGLSVACARCHDHKFDPISTEDYYALSGIFFSTRIIPGPVPGNTPLVRVPLLSPSEIVRLQALTAADNRRRAELERLVPDAADRAYRDHLKGLLTGQTAHYVVAAGECRSGSKPTSEAVAKRRGLHAGILAEWVVLLDRIEKQPKAYYPTPLREVSSKRSGPALEKAAAILQDALVARAKRDEEEATRSPEKHDLRRALRLHFRADDPRLTIDEAGRVTRWPNRAGFYGDATPPVAHQAPIRTTAKIAGHDKPVIRFDGRTLLIAPQSVPPTGTLFLVFRSSPEARAGERIVGWEDAATGKHGLGLMTDPSGRLHAILRKDGRSGDLVDAKKPTGFETLCVTWGAGGTTMRRNGDETSSKSLDGISSDPLIAALKLGGPGSGGSPRFTGDIAELRVFDRPLSKAERELVDAEVRSAWFRPDNETKPASDPFAELLEEMLSPRGTFWPSAAERNQRLAPEVRKRLEAMRVELVLLRSKPPVVIPEAVVVQDGGPKGTRHEGFNDARVFIRGDPKRPGKTVPRGFPKVLTNDRTEKITVGSGRLQLADWLTGPRNPLTARVMVNRIWQHHFGEGLVRTPNDFGTRGERPTHPELLDHLAVRFVESNWSVKAMHRLIMLSAVYQQSSGVHADALAHDPENRLFGRMNRRRLEAEAIRDSLLAVSDRLEATLGGVAFSEVAVPRRTLYLMSARTGANSSDFGRLFDRADPSLIVARRGHSVVAPQALFFLNDPFMNGVAKDLAARIRKESPVNPEARIRNLYALALGRPPSPAEIEVGMEQLAPTSDSSGPDPLERYCLLILCTNEFLYVD